MDFDLHRGAGYTFMSMSYQYVLKYEPFYGVIAVTRTTLVAH